MHTRNFNLFGAAGVATAIAVVEIQAIYSIAVPAGDGSYTLPFSVVFQLPYLVMLLIGCILNWISYWHNTKGMALASAIIYCASLAFGLVHIVEMIIPIILTFVGYAQLVSSDKKQQSQPSGEQPDLVEPDFIAYVEETPAQQHSDGKQKRGISSLLLYIVIIAAILVLAMLLDAA